MLTVLRKPIFMLFALLLLTVSCAERPVNPQILRTDPSGGYRLFTRPNYAMEGENAIVLAFSGGGMRAAAFSYGVLEFLRRTEITGPAGEKSRLLDNIGVITGVSGGSFTALAYGLYGDRLFEDYHSRFLKQDVQGEIMSRIFIPAYWSSLMSSHWGRSELAADYYDEVLFKGATFGELQKRKGPYVVVSATDISTGASLPFTQDYFDVLCSDLNAVRLSRAAAASSAVPVVLRPVTLNNYAGTCNFDVPDWIKPFFGYREPPRAASRVFRHLKEEGAFADARRPYLHVVDGGLSDNLGMRSVLDTLEIMEALHLLGRPTPYDHLRRIAVFVVNARSSPKTDWDRRESSPSTLKLMIKAAGVPIDYYSYEAMELLKDKQARWGTMRRIRQSPGFASAAKDPAFSTDLHTPDTEIYAIDVSFAALPDRKEFEYLNDLETSMVLTEEAVDRLRAAAGKAIMASAEFQRFLRDVGATIASAPPRSVPAAPVSQ